MSSLNDIVKERGLLFTDKKLQLENLQFLGNVFDFIFILQTIRIVKQLLFNWDTAKEILIKQH